MPPSLLAMRFRVRSLQLLLYVPRSVSALDPETPTASCCRCSLFPQEGCPLARYGREGQNKDANDFGVCVAGPVRPLVAVPLGPALQHAHEASAHKPTLAHRRETDGEVRITDASPNAIAPATSAAASGRNGPPCFLAGLSLSALCLVLSPQHFEAARRKRERQPCVYSYRCSILGRGSYCTIRLALSR